MRTEIIKSTIPGLSVYVSDYTKTAEKCQWCNMHLHTEHEVVKMESGEADFVCASGEVTHVKAGELVSIASGVPHEVYLTTDGSRLNVVQFNENDFISLNDDAAKYIDRYIKYDTKPLMLINDEKVTRIFDTIISEAREKTEGYEIYIKGCVYELTVSLCRKGVFDFSGLTQRDPSVAKIETALQYISNNYGKPLPLSQVSSVAGLAPSYFCRVFKKAIGVPFVDYLNRVRISRAADMLIKSDKSIIAISLETGFSSPSYFNRVFRMLYGCSPTEYKAAKHAKGE